MSKISQIVVSAEVMQTLANACDWLESQGYDSEDVATALVICLSSVTCKSDHERRSGAGFKYGADLCQDFWEKYQEVAKNFGHA